MNEAFDSIVKQLPKYQQRLVYELHETKNDYIEAAKSYLFATGPNDIKPFGGSPVIEENKTTQLNLLWENIQIEFNKFICGHKDYEEQRSRIITDSKDVVSNISVAAISGLIGSIFGMNSVIIAPVIVLLLGGMIQIGKNAYCKTYYSEKTV